MAVSLCGYEVLRSEFPLLDVYETGSGPVVYIYNPKRTSDHDIKPDFLGSAALRLRHSNIGDLARQIC